MSRKVDRLTSSNLVKYGPRNTTPITNTRLEQLAVFYAKLNGHSRFLKLRELYPSAHCRSWGNMVIILGLIKKKRLLIRVCYVIMEMKKSRKRGRKTPHGRILFVTICEIDSGKGIKNRSDTRVRFPDSRR